MKDNGLTPEQALQLYQKIDDLESKFSQALEQLQAQGKLINDMHKAFYPTRKKSPTKNERVQEFKDMFIAKYAKRNHKNINVPEASRESEGRLT